MEIDLVTHDAKKFFAMMLKKKGYVMEQVLSPLNDLLVRVRLK